MEIKSQLHPLRDLFRKGDKSQIKTECKELLAAGVSHRDIVRVSLSHTSDTSLADPSWLPAARFINLSDSLVHVALQDEENKHKLIVTGERSPEFRRIEDPPRLEGSLQTLRARFNDAVNGNDWQFGERCLLGIVEHRGMPVLLETLLETLLQPKFLGVTSGSWWAGVRHQAIGCIIHLWQEFGDEFAAASVCHFGAKQCCRKVSEPNDERLAAMTLLQESYDAIDEGTQQRSELGATVAFNEVAFREKLGGDKKTVFTAIVDAWRSGASVDAIDLAMTMNCIERLLRAGHGEGANWDNLKRELLSTAVIRRANVFNEKLAFKVALHAGWQLVRHGSEGLAAEIPPLKEFLVEDQDEQIYYVINGIGGSAPAAAIHQANNYALGGHDPEELLRRMIIWVNENCCGGGYYAGQRGMIDAWHLAKDHPERNRILLAMAGWMADYRNQHFKHKKDYGPIWGANLSDDGALLALRSGGTRVYDTATCEEVLFFRGEPWRFAFHPNSRLLACGWDGGRLQIWDLFRRKLVTEWEAFPDDVSNQFGDGKFWGMQFSPDGTLLAGCSRGCNEVRVWDTSTWKLKFELVGHTHNRNESVTFTPDSKTIATGGNDGTVRIWSATDGEQQLVFSEHSDKEGRLTAVDFDPSGEKILSAESASEMKVWDWNTGEVFTTIQGKGYCNYAGFMADGQTIVAECEGTLGYWDSTTGKLLNEIEAVVKKVNDHTIFGGSNQSRDRKTIVTAGWHGDVKLWNADTREQIGAIQIDA